MEIKNQKSKIQVKSQNFKIVIIFFILVFSLAGCAAIKETAKQIVGVSTSALEKAKAQAIKKTFTSNYATCYKEVKKIIAQKGFYIYTEDTKKKLIGLYISPTDTTAVGVFFSETDNTHTQIEVSSLSTDAKEFISKNIFSLLETSLNPAKEEGQANAQK